MSQHHITHAVEVAVAVAVADDVLEKEGEGLTDGLSLIVGETLGVSLQRK